MGSHGASCVIGDRSAHRRGGFPHLVERVGEDRTKMERWRGRLVLLAVPVCAITPWTRCAQYPALPLQEEGR